MWVLKTAASARSPSLSLEERPFFLARTPHDYGRLPDDTPPNAGPVYEAPAILWEQPFVALAQISQCHIPGESECIP